MNNVDINLRCPHQKNTCELTNGIQPLTAKLDTATTKQLKLSTTMMPTCHCLPPEALLATSIVGNKESLTFWQTKLPQGT
jgi:uncharacterized membrane protein